MISAEQARELFARANPVPDEDSTEIAAVEPSEGSRIIENRREEATVGGLRSSVSGARRRREAFAVAAVVVTLLGAVGVAM